MTHEECELVAKAKLLGARLFITTGPAYTWDWETYDTRVMPLWRYQSAQCAFDALIQYRNGEGVFCGKYVWRSKEEPK